MNPVPFSSDPERRRASGADAGRGRPAAVPELSVGSLEDVRPGSLLVAMPGLTDPNFSGSVVYVLDHSETGTLGVVLGRPSQVEIRDVLPGWSDLAVDPAVFHVGGPCETDTALCLAVAPVEPRTGENFTEDDVAAPGGLRRVAGDVHLVDLDGEASALAGQIQGLRVFAGYAGWSTGQLAAEIAEGAWACVPGRPRDVLSSAAGPDLWRQVMGRQTGRLGVLSTAPADPTAN
jgi:putative transcriptional regulator